MRSSYFHTNLKELRKDQEGFTLLELLIAVAISVLVVAAAAGAIYAIMRGGGTNDQALALRQVQNAGYWISRDGQMAQYIYDDVTDPDFLILKWTDWGYDGGSTVYHVVTYRFEDMSGGMKKLMRNHEDSESPGAVQQTLIAEHIYYDPDGDPGNTTKVIDYQSPTLTVRITARSGDATVSRIYKASQRPTF